MVDVYQEFHCKEGKRAREEEEEGKKNKVGEISSCPLSMKAMTKSNEQRIEPQCLL